MSEEKVSKPTCKTVVKKNVLIPMRDGITLAADLYGPDTQERFPAIIQYYPYRKDDFIRGYAQKVLNYFAARGYVGLEIDIRGTGNSEGFTDRALTLQQQEDGYDAVEWIAKQPWCDGNVGMTGVSYGGWTSYIVPTQKPPHLKAVVPIFIGDDIYLGHYPGGCFGGYLYVWYNAYMLAFTCAPPTYRDAEGRWAKVWKEHLEKNGPWLFPWLENQTTDSHIWREASFRHRYDDIQVPTFIIGGWRDIFPSAPRIYAGLSCPKKLLMGPWMHVPPDDSTPGPRIDYLHEMLRWFDHWLKGIDTEIMKEPPIAIYVQTYDPPAPYRMETSGEWRYENEWPIRTTQLKPYYLHNSGSLSGIRPSENDGLTIYAYDPAVGLESSGSTLTGFGLGVGLPLDQRPDEIHSASFTTEPLTEDVEVTGMPKTILHISSTSDLTAFVVKLCDVSLDGTSSLVCKGYLNAAHRNSHAKPEPIKPNEIYVLEIDMDMTSYLFQKGHRIRLDVASVDFPSMWPLPKKAENTIYHSAAQASRITLPIIPPQTTPSPKPSFKPSPNPAPTVRVPPWVVKRDISSSKASVYFAFDTAVKVDDRTTASYECSLNASTSSLNPSDTRMEGRVKVTVDGPGLITTVNALSLVQSNEERFDAHSSVETRVNDVPHTSRNWSSSFPRRFV